MGWGNFLSFFLSHCPSAFSWQGVNPPQVWFAHDLLTSAIFTHKFFPSNALICAMEEGEEQMCSWQQAEVHPRALRNSP